MQAKIKITLAFGLIMGLASCASTGDSAGDRVPANDAPTLVNPNTARHDEKAACNAGEERNENGDCERAFDFDRPFRRGGR